MKVETKKLINDLNNCFINNGNARFIDYKGVEKLLNQFKKDIVEDCKNELLKQMFLMRHKNDYPSEAVPKATILELPALMNIRITKQK